MDTPSINGTQASGMKTPVESADPMGRGRSGMESRSHSYGAGEGSLGHHVTSKKRRIDAAKAGRLCDKETLHNAKRFRFIDLFAGVGGMRLPFDEIGGRCVFTAEWDRFSCETYKANFPEPIGSDHILAGDIKPWAAEPSSIPSHDVLLAGFPCQPFSIAGVSKKNALGRPHGFLCETQGTLFYDLARIIDHHRPPIFLLENVKNLERHDKGRTFATIKHVLEVELGYKIFHKVIDSSPWVPQKRERLFIVGFKDHDIDFDFEDIIVPDGQGPNLGSILQKNVDPKYTLTDHLWNYLISYKEKHRKAGNGFGYSLFGPDDVARTLSARYYKDGSEILIEQKGSPRADSPLTNAPC
uniref:Cytosine-specific methyltransferase n=1 Tax=Amphimedon queenslandica TaxID=400682 RepID=A0A1X7TJ66_AMPQE|eukprot:XP_003390416.1 PREDICTED: uncharacterized protein LOC100635837 [Amphimedon queenslandica]